MIKYNLNTINDWNFGDDNIIKVYYDNALCYKKVFKSLEPSFNGKWLATYTAGTTSSAECDSTSAITQNEITLTDLQSVEIEDCVTSIGSQAFRSCTSLTSIDISDTVTSIGDYAFADCIKLTSISIPNGVTSVGRYTFSYCRSLTSLVIPSGVTSIGVFAFYYCPRLTSIDIPSGVTSIGEAAFTYCSGMTTCTIGSGVTSIGGGAFQNCSSLSSITVNATTPPTLGSSVFSNTNDCPIYVPSESLEAYKTANRWSDYASRIQVIP